MRPQDIAILLKIIALDKEAWNMAFLSNSLQISVSEVSESLNRSKIANLIDYSKKEVNRQNLFEFIEYGVKYVFPQPPGSLVRGIATAHSHPSIKDNFVSEINYVWPDPNGEILGLAIETFYGKQAKACISDPIFYKIMSLVDMVRIGKTREVEFANYELKTIILNEPAPYQYHKN